MPLLLHIVILSHLQLMTYLKLQLYVVGCYDKAWVCSFLGKHVRGRYEGSCEGMPSWMRALALNKA